MNFYESARFQYAAARLLVKLTQFRDRGRFTQKITDGVNFDIELTAHSEGSFNINIENTEPTTEKKPFMNAELGDILAFLGERLVEKIDQDALTEAQNPGQDVHPIRSSGGTVSTKRLDELTREYVKSGDLNTALPAPIEDMVKRRAAELYRERRLNAKKAEIMKIDKESAQKLISMSAPLLKEMSVPLRRSATSLQVLPNETAQTQPILFLDQKLAQSIETAIVDDYTDIILGNITQFNKDNGWGKVKIENNTKILSFNIPSDILPVIKQKLIDKMKVDQVYLEGYFVRDRGGEAIRLMVIGIRHTPK
ncbi:hypothetical protein [Roseomonas alba]|nr:hypothetical protein [Neoroseomonas alba]